MTFRVGQKVVCVRAGRSVYPPFAHSSGLREGSSYTIHRVEPDRVYLTEISAAKGHDGFDPTRFRPVVERKTDISFAHEILRRATKPARATPVALHQLVSE